MALLEDRLQHIAVCKEAIDKGFKTAREISEYTGISQGTIYEYSRENKIDIQLMKRGKPKFIHGNVAQNRKIVDKMIFEGRFQIEIAKKIGSHGESIRQYINKSEQYDLWKEKNRELLLRLKLEKEAERQTRKNLVSVLKSYAIQKAQEKGVEEAMRYYLERNRESSLRKREGTPYLLKLMKLVDTYKSAQERGEKLSYAKLSKISGLGKGMPGAATVSKIFKEMDLKSLYWEALRTPKWKIDAIERTNQNIDYFGHGELAYFLNMLYMTVVINSKRKKTSHRGGIIKFFTKEFGAGIRGALTYRDASQIYGFKEEFDASDEEISSAIGKDLKVVSYALEHRKDIEPKLIQGLQVIFPDKKIEKPYL